MSRLRKFNRNVLKLSADGREGNSDGDDEFGMTPLDIDEQEEIIQKFEVSAHIRNTRYSNILSLSYLVTCGFFLILAGRCKGIYSVLFVLGGQSMLFSCVTLRYELINDYSIFKMVKLRIDNHKIHILNIIILVSIFWICFVHLHESFVSQMFFQLPLILYIIATFIKSWAKEMEEELASLRGLKYKYKNA